MISLVTPGAASETMNSRASWNARRSLSIGSIARHYESLRWSMTDWRTQGGRHHQTTGSSLSARVNREEEPVLAERTENVSALWASRG